MFSNFFNKIYDDVNSLDVYARISQLEEYVENGEFDELFIDICKESKSDSETLANSCVAAIIKSFNLGSGKMSKKYYRKVDEKLSSLVAKTKKRIEIIRGEKLSQEIFDDACDRLKVIIESRYMGAVLACRLLIETGFAFLPKHESKLIEAFLLECADGLTINDDEFEARLNYFVNDESGYIYENEYSELITVFGYALRKTENMEVQLQFISDIVDEIIIQNQII